VDEALLHTVKRHLHEPKLEIGDAIPLKDGTVGLVVARYTASAHPNEIRYIVRVESEADRKRTG
jgi:hypothetical protein